MSIRITEIETCTAARPCELAFHRDAQVVELLAPFVQGFGGDGKSDVGPAMRTVGRDMATKGHRGAFRIAVLEEQQKDLSPMNVKGTQSLIGGEDGIAEQTGIKLTRLVEIRDAEGSFQDG